ncbi:MAG: HlyD family efflux transporter periplasmic adaptor subunit [Burkholderiaceae bacterium]|nr:HlyD family efflux transporter periplasmic adaptor subunit [Burkholderiaceae bacterium]
MKPPHSATQTHGMHRAAALAGLVLAAACNAPTEDAALSGYAEAELVYVAPTAAGLLQTLAVQRGDSVKRGQLLFALDADAEGLTRQAAQARSERATAQERNLRKGRRPAELQAIEAQLAQADAALAASTSALKRNRQLVEQGYQSSLRLEELVAARDRDAARARELMAARRLAREAARADEIAAAAAETRGSQADVALSAWREGQKRRESPAEAQVFDVMYRAGEWVNAGAPVVALLPAGALKVRFFVPEPVLARAAVGSEVALSCDGCAAGLRARIRWVSPQAEYTPPVIYSNASRSKLVFAVEAMPLDGATTLKPGQPVDVRFATANPP